MSRSRATGLVDEPNFYGYRNGKQGLRACTGTGDEQQKQNDRRSFHKERFMQALVQAATN